MIITTKKTKQHVNPTAQKKMWLVWVCKRGTVDLHKIKIRLTAKSRICLSWLVTPKWSKKICSYLPWVFCFSTLNRQCAFLGFKGSTFYTLSNFYFSSWISVKLQIQHSALINTNKALVLLNFYLFFCQKWFVKWIHTGTKMCHRPIICNKAHLPFVFRHGTLLQQSS